MSNYKLRMFFEAHTASFYVHIQNYDYQFMMM